MVLATFRRLRQEVEDVHRHGDVLVTLDYLTTVDGLLCNLVYATQIRGVLVLSMQLIRGASPAGGLQLAEDLVELLAL